jgi:phospholipid/cholesterol/gamma-HCH transport system substrate-binding protein
MINGIEVGKVKKVEIQPTKSNRILVTLRLSQDMVIPDKTVAVLSDGALLGGKIIRLRLEGKGNLAEDSFLKGETEVGVTSLLKERAIPVIANADSLLVAFRQISTKFDNTGTYLNTLLKTSNETVSNLNGSVNGIVADNRANIAQISSNMKTLSSDLIETEKQLRPLLTKFNSVADSLQALRLGKTLKEVDAAVISLKKIVQGLERGEGTAGKLIKNDSLYVGLNKTLVDLDKLLLDFRLQPKRYIGISVFGKKNTPPSN